MSLEDVPTERATCFFSSHKIATSPNMHAVTRRAPSKMQQQQMESTNFTAVIDLTLPPHAVPGKVFDVFVGTQIIRVTCPNKFQAGDTVRIKAPAFPVSPVPLHETITPDIRMFIHPIRKKIGYIVTIPPDVEPGATFLVKLDKQSEFRVRCPLTHRPGMSLQFVPPLITREQYGKEALITREQCGKEAVNE
jgi:hypothetical protein